MRASPSQQRVAAAAVDLADLDRELGRLVHRHRGDDLDRLERAESRYDFSLASPATMSALPTRKPMRQPAIENPFVSV